MKYRSTEVNNEEYFLSGKSNSGKEASRHIPISFLPVDREAMQFSWLVIVNLCSEAAEVPLDYI